MLQELQLQATDMIKVDMTAVNARSVSPWLLATAIIPLGTKALL